MVGAALPKAAAEAFDIANSFVLVRKVHFPYQRAVTEDPHDWDSKHRHDNKHGTGQETAQEKQTNKQKDWECAAESCAVIAIGVPSAPTSAWLLSK